MKTFVHDQMYHALKAGFCFVSFFWQVEGTRWELENDFKKIFFSKQQIKVKVEKSNTTQVSEIQ